MSYRKRKKSQHVNVRIPPLLFDMIVDIQQLLGTEHFTDAILHILLDWEKFRYLPEKERLLKLAELRFALFRHESKKPEKP